MIWRSRSLSARSSKSIVFSRLGSSGSPEAGEVTSRLDQTSQALTITLAHADELFCSAWNSWHRDLPQRVHPLPIQMGWTPPAFREAVGPAARPRGGSDAGGADQSRCGEERVPGSWRR